MTTTEIQDPATPPPVPPGPPRPPARRRLYRWRRPVMATTVYCAAVGACAHALLWAAFSLDWNARRTVVPWQPVVGIALVLIAVGAFGGFFVATGRARVAIAASFLLTFVILLSFEVTLDTFHAAARDADGGAQANLTPFVDEFRSVIRTIIAFYFGSEAVVSGAKALASTRPNANAQTVSGSDVDLQPQ